MFSKCCQCFPCRKKGELDKPIFILYCFECSRYFYTRSDYDKHMKRNHGLKSMKKWYEKHNKI